MSKPKTKDKKENTPALDLQEEKVQAKYEFTGVELVELGRIASRNQTEADALDGQLSSIKKDFQSRIEAAEMRRNAAFSKLTDGFEMREYDAVVVFNQPKKGIKTIHHLDNNQPNKIGTVIREEPMSPGDCQAQLFRQREAEEKKASGKAKPIDNPVIPDEPDPEDPPHITQPGECQD